MKLSKIATVALLSLGLSFAASAKEFRMHLVPGAENADGNFKSLKINKGADEGELIYELVPATSDVAADLESKSCPGKTYRVEGSVLSSNQAYDEENRRPELESVKILARNIMCIGISDR